MPENLSKKVWNGANVFFGVFLVKSKERLKLRI